MSYLNLVISKELIKDIILFRDQLFDSCSMMWDYLSYDRFFFSVNFTVDY